MITHRYSMAEICDEAIVLKAGRVIAQGPPAELRKSCDWFAQFAASGLDLRAAEENHSAPS